MICLFPGWIGTQCSNSMLTSVFNSTNCLFCNASKPPPLPVSGRWSSRPHEFDASLLADHLAQYNLPLIQFAAPAV